MRNFILLSLIFFSVHSEASFDRQYEYRSFSEKEMELSDYFDKIDSEYSSDILTYSLPLAEEARFQAANKAITATLGSLSRREFAKDVRLKIKHNLSDKVDFKYNYIEQEDYENSQTHSIIEFVYRASHKIHFSSFADLDFAKINNNVGFSISYLPKLNHEIRFFYNLVQFDRNKRNPDPDRFSKEPYSMGFVGRYYGEKFGRLKYFEYGFLNETPTDWMLPSDNLRYKYQRWMGTLRYINPVSEMETISIFYQVDDRRDKREEIASENLIQKSSLERNQLQVNYNTRDFERFELDSGSYFVYRNLDSTGLRREGMDLVPYVTLHFNKNEGASGFWSFGYDISADVIEETRLEHRGNIYWTARFKDNAYLKLAATLDVDDISWEGGSGQFVTEF